MFLTKGKIFYPALSNFVGEILLPAGEQLPVAQHIPSKHVILSVSLKFS